MSENITTFESVLKDLHLALQSEDCTIDECGTALLWAEARIALLEKACEASATYIRHDSLRPSAAHKNAFFRLCDAGYLGEGGDE